MTDPILAYERDVNKTYQQIVVQKLTFRIRGVDNRKFDIDCGPLLGRVSLSPSARDDQEFYVGHRPALLPDGVRVVSWVAPASAILFTRASTWKDQRVRVKRRFRTNASEIEDYADQWVTPDDDPPFAVIRRTIARPPAPAGGAQVGQDHGPTATSSGRAAPTSAERPKSNLPALQWLHERKMANHTEADRASNASGKPVRRRAATRPAGPPEDTHPRPVPPAVGDDSGAQVSSAADARPTRNLVLDAMNEPRRAALPSVLATLSPEQFAAVTADPTISTVMTGHPGTGKTIIATHRLAWLTHPERKGSLDWVLLVGPTDAWVQSVVPSVDDLTTPRSTQVHSTASLMRFFLEEKRMGRHRPDQHEDTSQELVEALRRYTASASNTRLDQTYIELREAGFPSESSDLRNWRRSLPPTLDLARDTIQLRPLLTYLNIWTKNYTKFTHVIVDEAQDLRPLDWEILRLLNVGSWTIVGDMNQRRTLFSINSWAAIGEQIDAPLEEMVIRQGYRSTEAIMAFASSLLEDSKERRQPSVLGDGEAPKVVDTRGSGRSVEEVALSEALRLRRELPPEGSVAIVTTDIRSLQLAAERSSWRRAGMTAGVGRYQKVDEQGTQIVLLLSPERARGLEFDAVVVVEPAAFTPARSHIRMTGQYRTLYTSLTRANRLLTVVHSRPLPTPLRAAISIRR